MNGRAPGADDDESGTMTTLEVLRVLLASKDILEGKAVNTIEFHWSAAEKSGLLGMQAIFREYERTSRDIKAMLEQDTTGFINLIGGGLAGNQNLAFLWTWLRLSHPPKER